MKLPWHPCQVSCYKDLSPIKLTKCNIAISPVILLTYSSCLNPMLRIIFFLGGGGSLWADSSHEAFCSSQDSSISEQHINSSAQQPCNHSKEDVIKNSQEKSPETVSNTSQSNLHIDLSQWSTTTPSSESVEIAGLQIYKDDVQTIEPKSIIVSFLFK